jgi:hypothetical protein
MPHSGAFLLLIDENITPLLFLRELRRKRLNHRHLFSVICSTITTTKNEKFAKIGNSSKFGRLESNANGGCAVLHPRALAAI